MTAESRLNNNEIFIKSKFPHLNNPNFRLYKYKGKGKYCYTDFFVVHSDKVTKATRHVFYNGDWLTPSGNIYHLIVRFLRNELGYGEVDNYIHTLDVKRGYPPTPVSVLYVFQ